MCAQLFKPRADPKTRNMQERPMTNSQCSRRLHRGVAAIFTLTVAANFAAMPFGPPPAVVTYAPLPPLLLLMATGLTMLVAPRLRAKRGLVR